MDKNLQVALDLCASATYLWLRTDKPSYENVSMAKIDLECACTALEQWLEDHVLDEPAIYHPHCSACLRGLKHTQREHDVIVELKEKQA